jgi:4-amino-4-deoxy-L-arabinose transferase-like glycosyltransferase
MTAWNRRDTGWLLLALLWLGVTLGVRPLALPDEGRYAGVAWEMLTSGNWLYPTLNGLPFFDKPPLFYWITAAGFEVFGRHLWVTRLAPFFAGGVIALAMYGFTLRQVGRRAARSTLLVLVTAPLFFGSAQFANLDLLVAAFISAAILLAAEAATDAANARPYRARLAAAYLCAALAVLSKGLMGIVLPGAIIVLWLAFNRRLGQLRQLLWLPGLALFALVVLPWFLAMQQRFPGFYHYFFIYQQFERYAAGGYNNRQPFLFYLPVLAVGLLPWTWWLVAGFRRRATDTGSRSLRSLMWIWAGVILVFFSIPESKMVGYILSAVPPLAWLSAAALLGRHPGTDTLPKSMTRAAAVTMLVLLSAIVAVGLRTPKTDEPLSKAIAALRQGDEPVLFVGSQFFDMPFYLGLREPVAIALRWNDPDRERRDDWRKTLLDSAAFDPELGRRLLVTPEQALQRACQQPTAWIIARTQSLELLPLLRQTEPTVKGSYANAWRVTAADLTARGYCGQTPSGY